MHETIRQIEEHLRKNDHTFERKRREIIIPCPTINQLSGLTRQISDILDVNEWQTTHQRPDLQRNIITYVKNGHQITVHSIENPHGHQLSLTFNQKKQKLNLNASKST